MNVTNTITNPEPQKRFTLAEMSAVMMNRNRPAFGFFVSQALWNSMNARITQEQGFGIGSAPIAMQGVQIAVDPSLPDTEFDVAFTEAAWSKRLSALRARRSPEEVASE
jgi:hypothetical protein